jgi:excinuclease ABC subunit C
MSSFNSKDFLANTPTHPGIYQMLDAKGEIIYIGKAKNLKARVGSYFSSKNTSPKTQLLVSRIANVELVVTQTETEAYLLEQTLIKKHRPRYNVLLRDDKSYPFIFMNEHEFPSLRMVRGRKQRKGRYFGPYVHSRAVHETLELIQKIFKIRSCEDTFFANRSRPCLQYQIKRCKAPCVNFVSKEEYEHDLKNAVLFLTGKSQEIIETLTGGMQQASDALQFEKAMEYRELINALQSIRQKQFVTGLKVGKAADVIFVLVEYGVACVQKLTLREGDIINNRSYFIELPANTELTETVDAFLSQHYLNSEQVPDEIYVNEKSEAHKTLATVLSEQNHRSIVIKVPQQGDKLKWLELARVNAAQALQQYHSEHASYAKRLSALETALHFSVPVQRIECFDVSHTQGEATMASCVVFNKEGTEKSAYRRFNIKDVAPGDDYAAMRQALTRRYQHLKDKNLSLPDILLIDGGKGQLTQAESVLAELNIPEIKLLGIAKGEGRKPGLETIYLNSKGDSADLQAHPLALLLLQEIRDEAHRFAITGHRRQRDKRRTTSVLEEIEGIGSVLRRRLLQHFGGRQGLQAATLEQMMAVRGISRAMAERIYETLH